MSWLNVMVKLGLDGRGFRQGLNQAQRESSQWASGFKSQLASMFTATAIVAATKKVVDYGGKISDLSKRLKVGTTDLQKYDYALKQSGATMEDLAQAFKGMGKAREDALKDPTSDAAQVFKALGIDEATINKGGQGLFEAIIRGFQNADFGGATEAMIATVLGKAGGGFLSAIEDGFLNVANSAEAVAAAMDEKTIQKLDEFGDSITNLIAVLRGPLATVINALVQGFHTLGQSLGGGAAAYMASVNADLKGVDTSTVAGKWKAVFSAFHRLFNINTPEGVAALQGMFDNAATAFPTKPTVPFEITPKSKAEREREIETRIVGDKMKENQLNALQQIGAFAGQDREKRIVYHLESHTKSLQSIDRKTPQPKPGNKEVVFK